MTRIVLYPMSPSNTVLYSATVNGLRKPYMRKYAVNAAARQTNERPIPSALRSPDEIAARD